MDLFDLNNKLKVARDRGFILIHINKLTIRNYSHQRQMNRHYYLKHQIPMMHRQFSKKLSQNKQYVDYFCRNSNNLFHFACQKRINQLN